MIFGGWRRKRVVIRGCSYRFLPLPLPLLLGQPVGPLFDPSTNPWWGIGNTLSQMKGGKEK